MTSDEVHRQREWNKAGEPDKPEKEARQPHSIRASESAEARSLMA